MLNIVKVTLLVLLAAILLTGCENKLSIAGPQGSEPDAKSKSVGVGVAYPIYVGQFEGGTLWVSNDANNLYLTYSMNEPWLITMSKVHVGATYADIPMNKNGVPIPGQFMYQEVVPGLAEYTHVIPLPGMLPGQTLVVAAHLDIAEMVDGEIVPAETGWGGNIPGGSNRWWYYLEYVWQGYDAGTETAWLRMFNSPISDPAYTYNNGEGGNWATYVMLTPTLEPQTFYFYAGQHMYVGTAQIWRDGDYLRVAVDMDGSYYLEQSHLQVYTSAPSGNPNPGGFNVHGVAGQYELSYPWTLWDVPIYVALHGVVGPF